MLETYPFILEFDENTPADVLRDMLISSHRATLAFMERNVLLEDENALLKRTLFGTSSEKKKKSAKKAEEVEPLVQVFDEAAVNDELTEENVALANAVGNTASTHVVGDTTSSNRPKRGRKPLPIHLPREDVIHDLADSDKLCACGCQLSKIGQETSEQLEVIPAQLKVLRHIRIKYACKACTEGVTIAPMPKQPIPKGIPTAGLLAHVAVAKFDDHLPLYRQSEIWDRLGVNLPRSTLSSWILKMGDLLQPMIPLLQSHIIQSGYVNADETTTQVLKEPGRTPTATSYMWGYI